MPSVQFAHVCVGVSGHVAWGLACACKPPRHCLPALLKGITPRHVFCVSFLELVHCHMCCRTAIMAWLLRFCA